MEINEHKHKFNAMCGIFGDVLIGSAGFVAALSWNDWIKSLFSKGGIFHSIVGSRSLLITAIVVTLVAFVLTWSIASMNPHCLQNSDNTLKKHVKQAKEKEDIDKLIKQYPM